MMSSKTVGFTAESVRRMPSEFDLEHADRVATLEKLEDFRIVPRKRSEIDLDPLLRKQPLAFLENRERLQAEEVELH